MMTPPDRPTITPALVDRFRRYLHHPATCGDWGSLHIVLADDNIGTEHVEFCIRWATEHDDLEGAALARILLTMSKSQRGRIGRFADMPALTTLDTISGPGSGYRTAHVVQVPNYVRRYGHPHRMLLHNMVWLDGQRRYVTGIEIPAVLYHHDSLGPTHVAIVTTKDRSAPRTTPNPLIRQ